MAWLGSGALVPAASQTTELQHREAEYRAALSELDAHRSNWAVAEQVWQNAVLEIRRARLSGDAGRLDAADRRADAAAAELMRIQTLVTEARVKLAARKEALEAVLDHEMRDLAAQIRSGAPPAQLQILRAQYNSLNAQLQEVQAVDAEDPLRPTLAYWPQLGTNVDLIDPRRDLESIRATVELLDRRVVDAREEIARIDERIERLRRRLEDQRMIADAANTLTRFGAGDPVGTNRSRGTPASESAGPQTIEQQIAALEVQRSVWQDMQQQLERRVAFYRERIPGLGGGLN